MSKRNIILLGICLCVIAFTFPFFIAENDTPLLDIIGVSFKALSAVTGILTLIIAILLYQKFSIDSVLTEKQTQKVLELVDILYGREVWISANNFQFISRFSQERDSIFNEKFYTDMAGMALITREKDFLNNINPIIELCQSYWMPTGIKESAEFLDITGFLREIEKEEIKDYAKLKFRTKENKKDKWFKIVHSFNQFDNDINNPTKLEDAELLVNDYITNKDIFLNTIANWLSKNSNVDLDHRLDSKKTGSIIGVFVDDNSSTVNDNVNSKK